MTMSASSMTGQILDPLRFPLTGSRLIEASAGTGKTWTIAALYLRFVLGHEASEGNNQDFSRARLPAEILVMTFTRAATRELSGRIRDRLEEAAAYFRGQLQPGQKEDPFLKSLRDDYPEGKLRDQAAWRLAMAADCMDEAAVHTIDAWCQRMLKEHAFDSGSLFDEVLIADEEVLRAEACQDYWRQQCYPLNIRQLQIVLSVWSSVKDLIRDMKYLLNQNIGNEGDLPSLSDCLIAHEARRRRLIQPFKEDLKETLTLTKAWLDHQTKDQDLKKGWNLKSLQSRFYAPWFDALLTWCQNEEDFDEPDLKKGWDRLTTEGMTEVRVNGAAEIELPVFFEKIKNLKATYKSIPEIDDSLRRQAANWIVARLNKLKRLGGTFGFTDMLHRLDQALSAQGSGERLRQRIRSQYPIALIDEFQDTSPLQFNIFDQIYQAQANLDQCALLLIGDPKQSIYGFRGADIYSYLKARRATEGRHYVLNKNFRSTRSVVNVVNELFARVDEKNDHASGAFMFRSASENPLPFIRVDANGRDQTLEDSHGEVPAMTLAYSTSQIQSGDQMRETFSALCAEQIVTWLNDRQAGFAENDKPFKSLRPADIAVLVRTGKEANAVRTQLRRRGVASVYLSDSDSVFESDEARDLYFWMRAVAMPRNVRFVRAALATRLIGFTLEQLEHVARIEEVFDVYAERLRDLQSVWRSQGVLAMLRRTLHQFDLPARWLKLDSGERSLTNFLHLAELLQTASTDLEGEQALIRWFRAQLDDQAQSSDEKILRLESDAGLVQVITIHKSKGLEYPIVFLPFVSSFRPAQKSDSSFLDIPDQSGHRNLILNLSDEDVDRADLERLKEDLRLLYVGLTRARHALWVGFSAIKYRSSEACQSHRSAMGSLLSGQKSIEQASDWLGPIQVFRQDVLNKSKQNHQDQVEPILLVEAQIQSIPTTYLNRVADTGVLIRHPEYRATFDKNWSIGSFSRLTKDIAKVKTQLSILQAPLPADDEPDDESKADHYIDMLEVRSTHSIIHREQSIRHTFHKGPVAGNFLHDQLEWLAAEHFALGDNAELSDRFKRRCEKSTYSKFADGLVHWLTAVVKTSLPGPNVSLSELKRVLPEMEFWLPTSLIETPELDRLCQKYLLNGQIRPPLPDRELHGMLMGFADLVFEHDGRYWVLDYKSNHLGKDDHAYDRVNLERSMADHRYDMQAALYMLALHRLLKKRLGHAYRPEVNLGGAVYLFLRGIEGPENGVYVVPPAVEMLLALDNMLNEKGVTL